MSDNTAYGTTQHTQVTCVDESQYEDVNKLWRGCGATTPILQLLTVE